MSDHDDEAQVFDLTARILAEIRDATRADVRRVEELEQRVERLELHVASHP